MRFSKMRVFIATFFLLLAPLLIGSDTWIRYYTNTISTRATIGPLGGGLYMVLGGCNQYAIINKNGDVLYSYQLPDSQITTLITTMDGGYIIGYKYNGDNYITKYSGDRVAQWSHQYSMSGTLWPILQTEDGHYVVVSEDGDLTVTYLNEEGDIIWAKMLSSSNYHRYSSTVVDSHGNIFILFYKNNTATNIIIPWVVCMNNTGNILWQKYYDKPHHIMAYELYMSILNNDNVIFTCQYTDNNLYYSSVIKIDTYGNVIGAHYYDPYIHLTGINAMPNNNIIVLGDIIGFNRIILNISSNGDIIWSKSMYVDYLPDDNFITIQEDNSNYMILGTGEQLDWSMGIQPWRIIKMDNSGEINGDCNLLNDVTFTKNNLTVNETTTNVQVSSTTVSQVDGGVNQALSKISWIDLCHGCISDSYEPDDTCYHGATPIQNGETQVHNFCETSGDWLSFQVWNQRQVTITTKNLDPTTHTLLELYDSDCRTLLSTDENSGPDGGSLIKWRTRSAGTYYLHVTQADGTSGFDHGYSIRLGEQPDRYEEDESCETSSSLINGGEVQTRNFADDPQDWVSFHACEGRQYVISTLDLDRLTDTVLSLYGPDCTTLLSTNDDSGGRASRIVWTAPADGGYHIKVQQKDNTTGDEHGYRMTLDGDTSSCNLWAAYLYESATTSRNDPNPDELTQLNDGTVLFLNGFDKKVVRMDESGVISYGLELSGWEEHVAAFGQHYILVDTHTGNFHVVMFDRDGSVLWDKEYHLFADVKSVHLAASRSGIVLGGNMGDLVRSFPYLLKLDINGEIEWLKYLGSENSNQLFDLQKVIVARNGDIICSGHYLMYPYEYYNVPWVARYENNGNMLWMSAYEPTIPLYSAMEISGTVEGDDGGVIMILNTNYSPCSLYNNEVVILKVDLYGNVEWGKILIYDYAGKLSGRIDRVSEGLYAVSSIIVASATKYKVIMTIDEGGNVVNAKCYQLYYDYPYDYYRMNPIIGLMDGSILMSMYGNYSTLPNKYFVKVDANGEIDPSCHYVQDFNVILNDYHYDRIESYKSGTYGDATQNASSTTVTPYDAALEMMCSNDHDCPGNLGDINGNGMITSFDASLILQIVVGLITPTADQLCRADVDLNGSVTSMDASYVLSCSVGLCTDLPPDFQNSCSNHGNCP